MDVKQLLDPSKIIEGVLLYSDSPGKTPSDVSISTGRVIFSLRELPKGVNFRTEKGNKVVRTSSWEVTLGGQNISIHFFHFSNNLNYFVTKMNTLESLKIIPLHSRLHLPLV